VYYDSGKLLIAAFQSPPHRGSLSDSACWNYFKNQAIICCFTGTPQKFAYFSLSKNGIASGNPRNPLKTWQIELYRRPCPLLVQFANPARCLKKNYLSPFPWVLSPENRFGNQIM
jgi:hypothetical protein